MVQFRLLGPLEAQDGERRVELGRPKQRVLLAVLLVHANDVVSLDRLVEELWGEEPPPQAAASLQTYVSNLRRALEPDRPARAPSRVLVSQPPGYRLVVGAGDLDAARFAALATEGHRLLQAGRPAAAAGVLREGLALWRGPALVEVADEAFAQAERNRLEELRVAALEDRLAADLDLGGHAAVVAELEGLAGRYRFRERLAGLLMLALYRSGRQGEALQAFQAARRALADELGIDPGRWLRQLETGILRQDPGLDWTPPPQEPGPSPGEAGGSAGEAGPALAASVTQRPQAAADELVGRDDQLAALDGVLAGAGGGRGRVVLVAGEPGIGKTRLAEEAARRGAAAGMQVAWGRCHEGDGAPTLWPWTQVVRQLAAELGPGQLAAMLGPSAAWLGQLMPELAEPAGWPGRCRLRTWGRPGSSSTRRSPGCCAGSPRPGRCWSSLMTCTGRTCRRCRCWRSWPASSKTPAWWWWAPTGTWRRCPAGRWPTRWARWLASRWWSGSRWAAWTGPAWPG